VPGRGHSEEILSSLTALSDVMCTGQNAAVSGGVKPAAGLSLVSSASYAELVNVASSSCTGQVLVAPSMVSKSYLMNKLTNVGICNGTQMPKTGQSLTKSELDAIGGWICEGAPKN